MMTLETGENVTKLRSKSIVTFLPTYKDHILTQEDDQNLISSLALLILNIPPIHYLISLLA